MHRLGILLILLIFPPVFGALNDSDCVKNTHITTAETSWSSRTICGRDNFENCTRPTNENADLPVEFNHGKKTEYVAVLFHGLSDSPYFLKDIGYQLFKAGMNVMIPRLTGHGTCAEHLNNNFTQLSDWIGGGKHRGDVPWAIEEAKKFGEKIYIGGFSLGGALATYAVFQKIEDFAGLLLVSPAFKLHRRFVAKVKFAAFFSSPLHRIYGGNKNYGYGVRYQKISAEGSYEAVLLGKKLQEFKDKNRPAEELPIFLAVTEYDNTIDVDYALDYVQNYLKGPKKIIIYSGAGGGGKHKIPDVNFIVTPELRHSSILLENSQWSEPEENPRFNVFSSIFVPYIESTFPNETQKEFIKYKKAEESAIKNPVKRRLFQIKNK